MARKAQTPADLQPAPAKPVCTSCGGDAEVRVKNGDYWFNLCMPCEIKQRTEQAKQYCASIGVKTSDDIRQWLKKNKLMVKRQPVLEREPGCDDE